MPKQRLFHPALGNLGSGVISRVDRRGESGALIREIGIGNEGQKADRWRPSGRSGQSGQRAVVQADSTYVVRVLQAAAQRSAERLWNGDFPWGKKPGHGCPSSLAEKAGKAEKARCP